MPETRRCVCSDSMPPFTDWRLVYLVGPRYALICDVHPCLCCEYRCGHLFHPIIAPSVSTLAASLPPMSCVSASSFPMCQCVYRFPYCPAHPSCALCVFSPYLASNLSRQYVFVRCPCACLSPSIAASISVGQTYLRFLLASTSPLCATASLPCMRPSLPCACMNPFPPSVRPFPLLHRALPIPSLVLYCLSRSSLPPSSSPAMHPVLFFIPCV